MSSHLADSSARLTELGAGFVRGRRLPRTPMLAMARQMRAEASKAESPLRRQVELSVIPLTLGQAMGLSEGQVTYRLAAVERVHDQLPATWLAYRRGTIDAARIREIGRAAGRLERDESPARSDTEAAAYASTHTVPELRGWLKRFVVRVEPDRAAVRAEKERAARRVDVVHDDDAMAWLTAYLPSHVAAAIDKRLDRAARAITDPDDQRTLAQRRADLLASWTTTNETDATEPTLRTDIAITIGADVLAGATDGIGFAADGSWTMPSAWVAEPAQTGSPFWHRMVLDPVTDDVLSHEYTGRYAPEILTKALIFRDGTCQAPGCLTPADRCDIDHRQPWPHHRSQPQPHVTTSPLPEGTRRHLGPARRHPKSRRTTRPVRQTVYKPTARRITKRSSATAPRCAVSRSTTSKPARSTSRHATPPRRRDITARCSWRPPLG